MDIFSILQNPKFPGKEISDEFVHKMNEFSRQNRAGDGRGLAQKNDEIAHKNEKWTGLLEKCQFIMYS